MAISKPERRRPTLKCNYWRVVPIDSEHADDNSRVFLYGELDEIVGPMTVEMAEAWIARFDKQPPVEESAQLRTAIQREPGAASEGKRECSALEMAKLRRTLVG